MSICKVSGCKNKVKGLGLCHKHYQRFKRNGHTSLIIEYNGPRRQFPDEYKSWAAMRDRCLNNNHTNSKYYSEKGIKICKRWQGPHGFANFLKDMGAKPSYKRTKKGRPIYTLDRINPNKGYSPKNCRWANWTIQEENRDMCKETRGVFHTPEGTWRVRYRGNGNNLVKTFRTKEEALKQRKEWVEKDLQ